MEKADREKLIADLSNKCRRYNPRNGPHPVEDIHQDFDHYQMDEAEKNDERRLGSLDTARQNATDPQKLAKENERIDRYYERRQEIIDLETYAAQRAALKANGFPETVDEPEPAQRQRGTSAPQHEQAQSPTPQSLQVDTYSASQQARDKRYSELISQENGEGDAPNRAKFLTEPKFVPKEGRGGSGEEEGRGNGDNPGALTPRSMPNRDFIARHTSEGNPGTAAPHPDPKRKPPKFDGPSGPEF